MPQREGPQKKGTPGLLYPHRPSSGLFHKSLQLLPYLWVSGPLAGPQVPMPFICKVYLPSFWALSPEQLKLHLAHLLLALNGFLNIYYMNFFTKRGFLFIYTHCYLQLKCIAQKAYECLSHIVSAGGRKTRKEIRIARLEATFANKISVKESTEECVRISSKEGKSECILLHWNKQSDCLLRRLMRVWTL